MRAFPDSGVLKNNPKRERGFAASRPGIVASLSLLANRPVYNTFASAQLD
jgi:hypothetical protein